MSNPIRSAVRYAIAIAAASAAIGVPAYAQQTPAASDEQPEEVVVTGSRIRRTEAETASPVQMVDRQTIERSGSQNIADVLRTSIAADNQGSIPTAFSAGFASGSSAVSLRGLGVNSTLVLVNGRRMATYGLADDGSRTFVDLNSIPLDAVERVEVLKDGGSALYGSDAVGGVVNIILRESYQGASLSGNAGTAYKDDGEVYRLAGSYGFGDLDADRYNLFATVEASKTGAINQADRPELGGTNLTSRGYFDNRLGAPDAGRGAGVDGAPAFATSTPYGSVKTTTIADDASRTNILSCPEISPQTGMCLYDDINFVEVQPEQERFNVFARGALRMGDTMQAYTELGWFHSYTNAVGTPGGINDNGVFNPQDPLNPVTAAHNPQLPATHPDNPIGAQRSARLLTTMFGGRDSEVNSDVARAIVGLKGEIGDRWSYDFGGGYIESNLYRTQTGFVRFPVLQQALLDGTFRFDPSLNSPELMSAISPELKDHSMNSVALVDGTLSGEIFDLPGGALGLAFGAEYRKEKSDTPPVPFTDTSEIVGLGYSAFKADREIYAGYVELNAPVLKSLELSGAFRYDHYSDYGHSSTPKFGVKWSPFDMLALRGTYSEAFRAPGPTESGQSSTLGFTNIAIITIGDPSVKPETAKSYTVGFVFEPTRSTNLSLDYFKIDRKNEITPADQASIVGGAPLSIDPDPNGDPQRFAGALPNSFLYYDEFGDLATISGPYSNLAKTKTDGLDFDLRQKFDIGDSGTLNISLLWTRVLNFEKVGADGAELEYVGTHGPYALSSAGGTPEDRGSLELSWAMDAIGVTARVNYVSSMKMIDHEGEELVDIEDGTFSTTTGEGAYFNVDPNGVVCGVYNPNGSVRNGCKVDSFTTVDLYGVFHGSENWQIDLSVTNLFNEIAPFDPYTYGGRNYNPAFHQAGAVGRFFTAGFKYTF